MAMHMVVAAVCLLQGTVHQAHAFGPGSSGELRVGSWNVLYKALDDAAGQAAIIKSKWCRRFAQPPEFSPGCGRGSNTPALPTCRVPVCGLGVLTARRAGPKVAQRGRSACSTHQRVLG